MLLLSYTKKIWQQKAVHLSLLWYQAHQEYFEKGRLVKHKLKVTLCHFMCITLQHNNNHFTALCRGLPR